MILAFSTSLIRNWYRKKCFVAILKEHTVNEYTVRD